MPATVRMPWRSSRRMVIWAPVRVSVMEFSLVVGGATGGLQKQNPRRFAPAGVGEVCLFALPDPRRRVRNDAYYDDYTYDDRRCRSGSQRGDGFRVHGRMRDWGRRSEVRNMA